MSYHPLYIIPCFMFASISIVEAQVKISQDLNSVPPEKQVDVIVQFANNSSARQPGKAAAWGATMQNGFPAINGAHYSIAASALKTLQTDNDVLYVSLDRKLTGASGSDVAYDYMPETIAKYPVAPNAGSHVTVALIDSGITANRDLADPVSGSSRILYSESFVPGDSSTSDGFGHGTHVAGIIAGNGANSSGSAYDHQITGVAQPIW